MELAAQRAAQLFFTYCVQMAVTMELVQAPVGFLLH
jgi:hypothetical protein